MGMVVRTNINSMNANRNLSKNNNMVAKSIEKLSSGYAINKAADDASGLAVSEKMRAQITGLEQGTSNTLEGVGLVQTGEGAMQEIHDMLNRIVELATKSANGTIQDEVDREAIQAEVDVLIDEIDRIAQSTNYNGIPLLGGMDTNTLIDTNYIDGILGSPQTNGNNFFKVSSGVSNTNSLETSSTDYYKSENITLAEGALSVPSDATLPYVISMDVVSYSENDSTKGDGSVIQTTTISLTVDMVDGKLSVLGSNGTDYAIEPNKTTNRDNVEGTLGYDYVKCTTVDYLNGTTNGSIVTSNEMRYIMEDLLNSLPTDLDAGGYTTYPYPSRTEFPKLYPNNSSYPVYPPGESYSDYVYGSQYSLGGSESSGFAYDKTINIYGGPGYTNDGRVLGVVSTVTQGGVTTSSVGSPTDFNASNWSSTVNVNELNDGEILGIIKVGESPRSEIKIPVPVSNDDIANMIEQGKNINDLVISIEKITPIYPDYPDDFPDELKESNLTTVETKKFVSVHSDFIDTTPSMFGDDVKVVYGDVGDAEHEIIDKLCDEIYTDLGNVRATRRLDDIFYDVPTDPNYDDKYTLQLGTYTAQTFSWDEEPYIKETWETLEDPIILHVADQEAQYNKVAIYIDPMTGEELEIKPLYVDTQEEAGAAIEKILNAINKVSENRANLGAIQNRLEKIINVNNNTSENMSAARSVIKDCDMAKEMIQYTKMNVLTQSAQSMLAQSNQSTQQILSLLE